MASRKKEDTHDPAVASFDTPDTPWSNLCFRMGQTPLGGFWVYQLLEAFQPESGDPPQN